MKYLLDTCVISELVAKAPARQVVDWIDRTDEDHLYLSVLTVGEIRKGTEKMSPSSKKRTLEEWLDEHLRVRFAERLVPVDLAVVLKWGELAGRLEKAGKPMAAIDSLIAATALNGHFTLVTRNEEDFGFSKVPVFNPWHA